VAVVGGGVIGLAVAWRLAQRGASVVLYERDELGGGATHVAAGMLAPVSEAEYGRAGQRGLELGLASARMWPDFAAELCAMAGADIGLRRSGTLIVARDRDEAEALEREIAFRRALGLSALRLRASEAREREPALTPTLRLALEAPDDHCVDPRSVSAALVVAARRSGARLCPRTEVSALLVDESGGRVTGLQLRDGTRVAAGRVVVAAGAWSGVLEGLPAGAGVRVRPVKGQTLRLRDPAGAGLLTRVVRFEGGYIVPRDDGHYVLGASVEERGFDTAPTAGAIYELLREVHELLPGVSEMVVEEFVVGLRPGSPDNIPVIGPGALTGLHWATGHHRNGILLAPLTAELIAAALGASGGEEPGGTPLGVLAAACTPERFGPLVVTA
jgi:glycine oxidase